jgi:folate-binding protein YgfZ
MTPCLIDLSSHAVFRLTGADRERYLNGQASNQVSRATERAAIEACVCNVKGKLDGVVFITRAEGGAAFWIDAPGELRESLFTRLSRYIVADDCELEDITDSGGMVLVHFIGETPDLPGAVWRAVDRFGVPGHDLWTARDSLSQVLACGNPLSREVFEDFRIRHGSPVWGAELGPDTLPAEAGLDRRAIDFHKGCYLGQEVVSRIESVGRVNRQLVKIEAVTPETAALEVGAELFADDREKSVGVVTSVSPMGPRALAYVRREFAAPETRLVFLTNGDNLESQIWETRAFD